MNCDLRESWIYEVQGLPIAWKWCSRASPESHLQPPTTAGRISVTEPLLS